MTTLSISKFLEFIVDRLVNVYKESPNVDFVIRLREVAGEIVSLQSDLADCRNELANLKEDSEPFRAQIDQRKTYRVNTPKHKAASDLFDAVKDEW